MEIGLDPRMKSCTRSSNEVMSCTIKGFLSISLISVSEPKWDPDQAGSACDRDLRILAGSACDRDLRILVPFRGCLLVRESITDIKSILTQRALTIFCETYHIPDEVHPQLPSPTQTIHEMPSGKIGVYTSKGVPKDPFPKSYEFNAKHFATLVVLPAPFHKYPEPFHCLVGISRYYTLDEDAYHEFLSDNDEGMDLLAFIQTADPTKVRVAERQRVEDEPRLPESTVGRVVPLLLIAPARASSELEASVDKLFDKGASGDGQKAASCCDHRHYSGGRGSMTEARGEPIPTLPFVTSSVSATPECEDKSSADSVPGLNLRTIGAPQRSSAPAIANDTTVTVAVDADAIATKAPVAPSLFGVGSSSTGRTDSVPGGFSDVCGSDFLIGGIRTVVDPDSVLQKVYVSRWSATNGFGLDDNRICREMLDQFAPLKFFASVRGMDHDQLFTEFNVGAARQISLNAEVRMRAEYNIREKRKLRAVDDEQAELLKAKDGEIKMRWEFKRLERCLREGENNELGVKVTDISASVKFTKQEVADLDAQVTAVKLQNDNLVGQISSVGIQEKIAAYEGFVSQLEKFQNEKLEEVNEKFDKLCADFVDMALHLEEKFYPHLLTTISGRQWLLTYGIELAVAKCLNSTEYLSALGAAISKAVENGMQEGLSVGITHGAEGRQLADVAAYNPYAEADYLSVLQHLQNVNFSLIAELKSNKDASVDAIMNLLCLDDVLTERLGLTESQPHVNQLMVPIYHSPDQRVVNLIISIT
nr:putative transposase (putative), gypsy type [Tanacetum cinerariifolium]